MVAIASNLSQSHVIMISGRISQKNSMIASIFGPFWKRLQAYIIRFIIKIAHLVPFEIMIASILDLHCYQDCRHLSSHL